MTRPRATTRGVPGLRVAALLSIALGCGGSAPTAPAPTPGANTTPPAIRSIEIIVPAPMQTLALPAPLPAHIWAAAGQSAQLTALADGAIDVTSQAEWAVTAGDFATITASGLLTAHRAGNTPLRATYDRRTAATFLTVFQAAATVRTSFTGVLGPGQRRRYFVTVGAGGRDVVYLMTGTGAGLGPLAVLFAPAIGDTCVPPYTFGPTWSSSAFTGASRADAKGAGYQVPPGRYCVVLVDPATITADDGLSAGLISALTPLSVPVEYALIVGASGAGASVASTP